MAETPLSSSITGIEGSDGPSLVVRPDESTHRTLQAAYQSEHEHSGLDHPKEELPQINSGAGYRRTDDVSDAIAHATSQKEIRTLAWRAVWTPDVQQHASHFPAMTI